MEAITNQVANAFKDGAEKLIETAKENTAELNTEKNTFPDDFKIVIGGKAYTIQELVDHADLDGDKKFTWKDVKLWVNKIWNGVKLWIFAFIISFLVGLSLSLFYNSEIIIEAYLQGNIWDASIWRSIVVSGLLFSYRAAKIRDKDTLKEKDHIIAQKDQIISDKDNEITELKDVNQTHKNHVKMIVEKYDQQIFLRDLKLVGNHEAIMAKDTIVRWFFEKYPELEDVIDFFPLPIIEQPEKV